MRALPILLLLASCGGAPTDARRDSARALYQVALAEARLHGQEKPAPCVVPVLDGLALDRARSDFEHRTSAALKDRKATAQPPDAATVWFPWRAPQNGSGGGEDRKRASAEVVERLTEAARPVITGPARAQRVTALDQRGLPPPLRVCTPYSPSMPNLRFSAPAIEGDVAFVETGYVCGGLCGNGLLYGLRRKGSGWTVVGVADTWVS